MNITHTYRDSWEPIWIAKRVEWQPVIGVVCCGFSNFERPRRGRREVDLWMPFTHARAWRS